MAQKRIPKIYEATVGFYHGRLGVTVVPGNTVVEGHPLLKGGLANFRPFVPTYGALTPEPEEAEPEKVEAS